MSFTISNVAYRSTAYLATKLHPWEPWMDEALCKGVDPDVFFPVSAKDEADEARHAKSICAQCPVREACLDYAITYDERGIWGGTTEGQRRRIRERRARERKLGA